MKSTHKFDFEPSWVKTYFANQLSPRSATLSQIYFKAKSMRGELDRLLYSLSGIVFVLFLPSFTPNSRKPYHLVLVGILRGVFSQKVNSGEVYRPNKAKAISSARERIRPWTSFTYGRKRNSPSLGPSSKQKRTEFSLKIKSTSWKIWPFIKVSHQPEGRNCFVYLSELSVRSVRSNRNHSSDRDDDKRCRILITLGNQSLKLLLGIKRR